MKDNITFEVTRERSILDVEEFCQIVDNLTYVGHYVNTKTSKIIPGVIVQFKGKFYSTEIYTSNIGKDMIKTVVSLLTTDYYPKYCKSLKDCSIFIDVWDSYHMSPCLWEDRSNINSSDSNLICSYAFSDDQLAEAQKIANSNKYVNIFLEGVHITKEYLLKLKDLTVLG